jgi:hypothetical protein
LGYPLMLSDCPHVRWTILSLGGQEYQGSGCVVTVGRVFHYILESFAFSNE